MTSLLTTSLITLALGLGGAAQSSAMVEDTRPATLQAAYSYLSVPEVRSDPESRSIEVAYLHLDGGEAGNAETVPTFVFFGGPGGSALDYETLEGLSVGFADLLANGDVVFIEQRGVGASRPLLACEPVVLAMDEPLTRAALAQAHQRILPDCIDAAGADMRGYTAAEIADDAEAIRQTLGFDRINLSGGSFGAQQAYYYLRRHGEHVNRAVLSQFLSPASSLVDPAEIDAYITQIGDRVGPAYGYGSDGGQALLQLIQTVFERVETEPVAIPVGDTSVAAGRTDLAVVTALALRRSRESWLLPMLFTQMNAGEFGFIGQIMMQYYRSGLPVNAAVYAFDCAAMGDTERRERIEGQFTNGVMRFGASLPFPDVCDDISHAQLDDTYLGPVDFGGVPTLLIQGELDARARDEDFFEAISGKPTVRMLTILNATHDLGRSVSDTIGVRIDAIEAGFLARGEWPEAEQIEVPLSLN
jgi:pimeloyl-ACP methyl ester carboxylesterase